MDPVKRRKLLILLLIKKKYLLLKQKLLFLKKTLHTGNPVRQNRISRKRATRRWVHTGRMYGKGDEKCKNQSIKKEDSDLLSFTKLDSADISDDAPHLGHYARHLTQEEMDWLRKDNVLVSDFKQGKLDKEAQKNWDLFYKRNATNFFKDRHWTQREFHELSQVSDDDHTKESRSEETKTLLEVGCGVGNFIFPLIAQKAKFFIYACDFSNRAIEYIKGNPLYNENVCYAFQADITKDDLSSHMAENSVDIISVIFVLSSLHPDAMPSALVNLRKVLRPGGIILFRDYGLYDQAMLRFAPGHKLSNRFYVRQDGTRAFFFSEDYVKRLFTSAGFGVYMNKYVQRQTTNLKEGVCVPRVFVQGKFFKTE